MQEVSRTFKVYYSETGVYNREYEIRFLRLPKHDTSYMTFFDEEEVRMNWLYPTVRETDVFVDIGASYGSYSVPLVAMGVSKVIAFSPQFEYETLKKNIELNIHTCQKYHIYKNGLYDKHGYLTTFRQKFFSSMNDAMIDFDPDSESDGIIEVIPLDILVNNNDDVFDKIDIMKIDVEGAELNVLKGARATIKKFKPRLILIENHLFKFPTIDKDVINFIDSLGLGYESETGRVRDNNISHTRFRLI